MEIRRQVRWLLHYKKWFLVLELNQLLEILTYIQCRIRHAGELVADADKANCQISCIIQRIVRGTVEVYKLIFFSFMALVYTKNCNRDWK